MFLGEGAEGQTTTWKREREHLRNVTDCQEHFGSARLTQTHFLWSELSSTQTRCPRAREGACRSKQTPLRD